MALPGEQRKLMEQNSKLKFCSDREKSLESERNVKKSYNYISVTGNDRGNAPAFCAGGGGRFTGPPGAAGGALGPPLGWAFGFAFEGNLAGPGAGPEGNGRDPAGAGTGALGNPRPAVK
jgi:hypothetical protein